MLAGFNLHILVLLLFLLLLLLPLLLLLLPWLSHCRLRQKRCCWRGVVYRPPYRGEQGCSGTYSVRIVKETRQLARPAAATAAAAAARSLCPLFAAV